MTRPSQGTLAAEVFRNELRSLVRDRRAFLTAVVLPVLLYPLLFVGMEKLGDVSESTMEEKDVAVAFDLDALGPDVSRRVLTAWADPALRLTATRAETDLVAAFVDGDETTRSPALLGSDVHLLVTTRPGEEGAPPVVELWADRSSDLGNLAVQRAGGSLRALGTEVEGERLLALVEKDPGAALATTTLDVAPAEDTAGHALGRLLPVIAVLVLLSGASFAALGAFAAEREAGTLETLLVQPVPAAAAAGGKFLAVLLVAVVALFGNIGSFLACTALGLGAVPGAEGASGATVGLARILTGAVLFLPPTVLLAALACLVSARAKSFREGQHYIFPLILLAAAPASLALMSQVELDWALAVVPIAGAALGFRDAMAGNLAVGPAVLSVVAGGGWAWLVIRRLGQTLDAERLLATGDTASETAARRIQSRRALGWGLAAVIVIYFLGGRLQAVSLTWGLGITLWVLAPALAVLSARGTARRAGEGLASVLGLGRPAPHHLVGAVLVVPALVLGMVELLEWQRRLLPLPTHMSLGEIEQLSAGALFFLLALSPGFFEELLFRGAILSGLRKDLRPRRVVLWQALLFGAVHASIYRFVPTALLGGVLAAITLRARCIWPAVLLHVTYDALLVLERVPLVRERAGLSVGLGLLGAMLLALPRRGPTRS